MRLLMGVRHVLEQVFIAPVRFYQQFISPMMPPSCRYAPTCSNYAIEALTVHGVVKGTILAIWRLLRCNPWSHGGVDYVPERGQWKPKPWIPPDDWVGHQSGESSIPMGLETMDAQVEGGSFDTQDLSATTGLYEEKSSPTDLRSHE